MKVYPLDGLSLSIRSYNALLSMGLDFTDKICAKRPGELLKSKNFGKKSLKEVKEALAEKGLFLVEDNVDIVKKELVLARQLIQELHDCITEHCGEDDAHTPAVDELLARAENYLLTFVG